MAWTQIQGITILANLNDSITLPTRVLAIELNENNEVEYYWATIDQWKDQNGQIVTKAKTDKEGEFLYYGAVTGYAGTVYCSVVVGGGEPNPESIFPTDYKNVNDDSKPDEWGNIKEEVRTSDMDGVTSYQYYKSKLNRTSYESAQLQKLTELLNSKIIMARDINHIRNAVTNTQEFCLSLRKALDETITDMENIGTGTGDVFYGLVDNPDPEKFGKVAQLRKIKQSGDIEVTTEGEDIVIHYETPPPPAPPEIDTNFCNKDVVNAKSYTTCSMFVEPSDPDPNRGAYYSFGNNPYCGWKVRNVGITPAYSPFGIFGQGDGEESDMINAGRIIKGKHSFVIEMKTGKNTYSGICIYGKTDDSRSGKVELYENSDYSRIQQAIEFDNVDKVPTNDKDAYGVNSRLG